MTTTHARRNNIRLQIQKWQSKYEKVDVLAAERKKNIAEKISNLNDELKKLDA